MASEDSPMPDVTENADTNRRNEHAAPVPNQAIIDLFTTAGVTDAEQLARIATWPNIARLYKQQPVPTGRVTPLSGDELAAGSPPADEDLRHIVGVAAMSFSAFVQIRLFCVDFKSFVAAVMDLSLQDIWASAKSAASLAAELDRLYHPSKHPDVSFGKTPEHPLSTAFASAKPWNIESKSLRSLFASMRSRAQMYLVISRLSDPLLFEPPRPLEDTFACDDGDDYDCETNHHRHVVYHLQRALNLSASSDLAALATNQQANSGNWVHAARDDIPELLALGPCEIAKLPLEPSGSEEEPQA